MTVNSIDRAQKRVKLGSSIAFVVMVVVVVALALAFGRGGNRVGGAAPGGNSVDNLWVLICAALVFFMQAGFLCFGVGLARSKHGATIATKNVIDWAIGGIGFFVVGFGFMFGASQLGVIGTGLFFLEDLSLQATTVSGVVFFLFQLAFAGTAITLVSGSLLERTNLLAYLAIAAVVAVIIYPIYGHWVWGNLLIEGNGAWLADLGFHDFAGGTVVHLVGAVVALVGVVMVGPRVGRFDADGKPQKMASSSVPLSQVGVFILWFGWWGFNGGSYLQFGIDAADAILVTNVSAIAGLVGAASTAYLFQGGYGLSLKLAGGAVGGLVAITPGADVVTPAGAIVIGLLAGIIYSFGNDLLLQLGVDDALGVIPAHGFGSILGTLALAVFAADGAFNRSWPQQLVIQLLGIIVCIIWAASTSLAAFSVIRAIIGLRVSPRAEISGIDLDAAEWPYGANGAAAPKSVLSGFVERGNQVPSEAIPAARGKGAG